VLPNVKIPFTNVSVRQQFSHRPHSGIVTLRRIFARQSSTHTVRQEDAVEDDGIGNDEDATHIENHGINYFRGIHDGE
jgi:hypothetical protein